MAETTRNINMRCSAQIYYKISTMLQNFYSQYLYKGGDLGLPTQAQIIPRIVPTYLCLLSWEASFRVKSY